MNIRLTLTKLRQVFTCTLTLVIANIAISLHATPVYALTSNEAETNAVQVLAIAGQLAANEQPVDSPAMSSANLNTIITELSLLTSNTSALSTNQRNVLFHGLTYLDRYSFYGKKPNDEQLKAISSLLLSLSNIKTDKDFELDRLLSQNLHRWLTIADSEQWLDELTWLTAQLSQNIAAYNPSKAKYNTDYRENVWQNLFAHITYLRWLKNNTSESNKEAFAKFWPLYYKQLSALLAGQLEISSSNENAQWVTQHLLWLVAKSTLLLDTENASTDDEQANNILTTIDQNIITMIEKTMAVIP